MRFQHLSLIQKSGTDLAVQRMPFAVRGNSGNFTRRAAFPWLHHPACQVASEPRNLP